MDIRRSVVLPIAVFLGVLVATVVAGLALNAFSPALGGNAVAGPGLHRGIYRLSGLEPVGDETYSFELTCVDGCPDLVLLSFAPTPAQVWADGVALPFEALDPAGAQLRGVRIPAELTERAVRDGTPLVLTLDAPEPRGLSTLALCSSSTAQGVAALFGLLSPMVLGALVTIALYGLLLWFAGRDGMLLTFSAYTGCLFLWGFSSTVSSAFGVETPWLGLVNLLAFDCAVVLGMATCFSCCRLELPPRWRWLNGWRGVAVLCLIYTVIARLVPSGVREWLPFAAYTLGAALLAVACARADRKPWVVLGGLAVTQGLRVVALAVAGPMVSQAFAFAFLRQLRALSLPYLVCCSVYVGLEFARRFRRVEALSLELERTNRELDRKVEERTAQLVEQQRRRQAFMLNVFHDLRTPLFVMKGCVDRLKAGGPSASDHLQVLDERLSFTTRLAEDLFSVAKLEDDALMMETEPVDMDALLVRAVRASSVEAEQRGVRLSYRCRARCVAWGDEVWLARAFQNLLANALAHAGEPGTCVRLVMEERDGRIVVTLSDDGAGIDGADLDRLFDRYFRAGRGRDPSSSGLGLSITADVVEHHGGTVEACSEPGEGTTFTVTLPLWGRLPEPAPTEEALNDSLS